MISAVWDEITSPFLNFNGCTVDVWERIRNFIPHFIMDEFTYACWDYSQTIVVKAAFIRWHLMTYARSVNYTIFKMVYIISQDLIARSRGKFPFTGKHQPRHARSAWFAEGYGNTGKIISLKFMVCDILLYKKNRCYISLHSFRSKCAWGGTAEGSRIHIPNSLTFSTSGDFQQRNATSSSVTVLIHRPLKDVVVL